MDEQGTPPLSHLINEASEEKINELIKKGWDVSLHFGNITIFDDVGSKLPNKVWEANFTRSLDDDDYSWQSFKPGVSSNLDTAIDKAYNNLKDGRTLGGGITFTNRR